MNKFGEGTLILSGINTYAGGTFVANGTLVLQNATSFGTAAIAVANNAALVFAQSTTNATYSGSITGSSTGNTNYGSSLTKTGAGTLVLGGANNYGGPQRCRPARWSWDSRSPGLSGAGGANIQGGRWSSTTQARTTIRRPRSRTC